MSAIIDGHPWQVSGLSKAYFGTEYLYTKKRFTIDIEGISQDSGVIPVGVEVLFDFVPKTGRYYFNNQGPAVLDSGTIAVYTYHNIVSFAKWSNGGYVDISKITKDSIEGDFNFTAKGDIVDTTTSVITFGQFSVYNAGSNGGVWPGP